MRIRDKRRAKRAAKHLPFIGPQPTVQTYRVNRGGTWVVLQLSGDCGQWVTFLKPEDAEALADTLMAASTDVRASRTGLSIASDDEVEQVARTANGTAER